MRTSEVDYDTLWDKTQKLSAFTMADVANTTQPMKLTLSQSLTIYNLPQSTTYKEKSGYVSEVGSVTQSTKLISENHDSHSGYNLRKQIFQELTQTSTLDKKTLS